MRRSRKFLAAALAAALGLGVGAARAEPGGCLKYGAAGAVAGHLAHHHGVIGAMGGCAVGMYKRHKYRKHLRQMAHHPATGTAPAVAQ